MPAVYRSADLYVFPTLRDAWGLVVNEALLSGVPVLGSMYAGCAPELLPAESTFDPLDPADFKAKLRLGVEGRLPVPDVSRIWSCEEVGRLMVQEIQRALRPRLRADLVTADQ